MHLCSARDTLAAYKGGVEKPTAFLLAAVLQCSAWCDGWTASKCLKAAAARMTRFNKEGDRKRQKMVVPLLIRRNGTMANAEWIEQPAAARYMNRVRRLNEASHCECSEEFVVHGGRMDEPRV
jgi:hypothetical protein